MRFEELEIRRQEDYPDPFPLYPYELLHQDVRKFIFLKDNEALILRALRPFTDTRGGEEDQHERFIDDEYLFKGPGTYEPRIEEEIKQRIEAIIVLPNNALLLTAVRDTEDFEGNDRKAGESVRCLICLITFYSGCTGKLVSLCRMQKSRSSTSEKDTF